MTKVHRTLYMMIYVVMLLFGGLTVISTQVIGSIATISDPFTSFMMVLVSFVIFFGVIPWAIWKSGE